MYSMSYALVSAITGNINLANVASFFALPTSFDVESFINLAQQTLKIWSDPDLLLGHAAMT